MTPLGSAPILELMSTKDWSFRLLVDYTNPPGFHSEAFCTHPPVISFPKT